MKIKIFLLIALFALTGCNSNREIKVENKLIEVTIVHQYYESGYTVHHFNGSTHYTHTYSPEHHIIVEYFGITYDIEDETTYFNYRNKVGQTVPAIWQKHTYEDGSVKYNIILDNREKN